MESDSPEKIFADAQRYRQDAMQQLAGIEAGKTVPAMAGRTKDEAIRILMENVQILEKVMSIYGWKGDGGEV